MPIHRRLTVFPSPLDSTTSLLTEVNELRFGEDLGLLC